MLQVIGCNQTLFSHYHLSEMVNQVHFSLDHQQYDQADRLLHKVSSVSRSFFTPKIMDRMGDAYVHAKQYEQARQVYDKGHSVLKLVKVLLQLGEYNSAQTMIETTLGIDPAHRDHVELKLLLGNVLDRLQDYEYASRVYASIRDVHRGAAILYAKCLFHLQKPQQAQQILQQAASLSTYELIADVLVIANEMDTAIDYYHAYINKTLDPGQVPDLSTTDVVDKLMLTASTDGRMQRVYEIYQNLLRVQCDSKLFRGCCGLSVRMAMLQLMMGNDPHDFNQIALDQIHQHPDEEEELWQIIGMNLVKTYRCSTLDARFSHKDQFAKATQQIAGIPKTFNLPKDRERLMNSSSSIWIVKPARGSGGRGIRLTRDLTRYRNSTQSWVVQEYISDPYVLQGKKIDLRLYVIVSTHPERKIYRFDDGIVRSAAVVYDLERTNSLDLLPMHLTNTEFNAPFSNVCDTSVRTFHEFEEHFTAAHGLKAWNKVLERLDTLLSEAMTAVLDTAELPFCKSKVFGADILLDSKHQPWLLEFNAKPNMYSHCGRDLAMKTRLTRVLFLN